MMINHDINILYNTKFELDTLSKNNKVNNKVLLFHLLLIFLRNLYHFSSSYAIISRVSSMKSMRESSKIDFI